MFGLSSSERQRPCLIPCVRREHEMDRVRTSRRGETMSKTMSKIKHLLVSLLFTKLGDADFVSFCRTVATRLPGNPAFPAPPVDPTVFKTAVDTLATTLSEAQDGGRKAIAEKNKQRDLVTVMMRKLAHYVEANCN